MSTPNKTAPDFGEPWHEQEPPHPISVRAGVYWLNPRQFNRAVACVSACSGLSDPAAEIQALRDAVKEAKTMLERCYQVHRAITLYAPQSEADKAANREHCEKINTALAKLQPFIKP